SPGISFKGFGSVMEFSVKRYEPLTLRTGYQITLVDSGESQRLLFSNSRWLNSNGVKKIGDTAFLKTTPSLSPRFGVNIDRQLIMFQDYFNPLRSSLKEYVAALVYS